MTQVCSDPARVRDPLALLTSGTGVLCELLVRRTHCPCCDTSLKPGTRPGCSWCRKWKALKMPKPRSRKARLNELQRIQTIWDHASVIADDRDPKRHRGRDDFTVQDMDAIACKARNAFLRLTGFFPWDVRSTELNNRHPSARIAKALKERTTNGEPVEVTT